MLLKNVVFGGFGIFVLSVTIFFEILIHMVFQ